MWVDKGSELNNRSKKSWLKDNDLEMYSTYNGKRYAVSERFIRSLKNKIYKYMNSVSKHLYIDRLDNLADK